MISKEGFSGANDTSYMKKTNENFYSSFKSKPGEQIVKQDSNGAGNAHDGYNSSDLEREQRSPAKPKNSMYNIMNSNTVVTRQIKNRKKANRSKQSHSNGDQTLFSYEIKGDLGQNNRTGKIFSKKVDELDSDMEKLENDDQIFEHKNGNMSYDDARDHLKSFRKQNEPSSRGTGSKHNSSDRHGIINYRAITGISAPGRAKHSQMQKPDNIIAPWKMQKRNRIMNKQAQNYIDQRSYNMSSKRKQNLATNASNSSKQNSTNKAKQKVKIPKITNRDGLNSQPSKLQNQHEAHPTVSRNPDPRQGVNTAGNVHKLYQTPSFLSPNGSRVTERAPTFSSETTYSKSTLQEFNASSMIEKHTIIFESETEHLENMENHSDAPTESYVEQKRTINLDGSSVLEGGDHGRDTDRRTSEKVDSERPPQFNVPSEKNIPTFRENKKRSQSDIYYNDVNLEEEEEDPRAAKTALHQTRVAVNASKITMGKIQVPENVDQYSASQSNKVHDFTEEHHNSQLNHLEITPSEKEQQKDQIYLNTNAVEQNPHLSEIDIKSSASVSKHTLNINTHTAKTTSIEQESDMS